MHYKAIIVSPKNPADRYAMDAASAINRRLGDQGLSSWPRDAQDADLSASSAVTAVEEEIEGCGPELRDDLTYELRDTWHCEVCGSNQPLSDGGVCAVCEAN